VTDVASGHGRNNGTATDPVCGMTVDPANARGGSFTHDGTAYYFCSPGCREKFVRDPEHWLHKQGQGPTHTVHEEPRSSKPEAGAAKPIEWTCPMHPQIVRNEPGTCPICGMALEPRTLTSAPVENPELRDMTRRFWGDRLRRAGLRRGWRLL
jgi:Cu+-exporting ATPase